MERVAYENLPIQSLPVGTQVSGTYRGQKFYDIPDEEGANAIMGRVFIETAAGPIAVGGDGTLQRHVSVLEVSDGDRIIILRPGEFQYRVVRELD